MSTPPSRPDPQPRATSAAARLSRARDILAEAGRPFEPAELAVRGSTALTHDDEPPAARDDATEIAAGTEPEQPEAAGPEHVGRASALAFAVMTGAIKPLTRIDVPVPSTLTRLGTKLFPAPAPGQPSRLELSALGAALVGAAFIGTTLPGSQPVQAQGAPPALLAAAPATAVVAAPAADTSDTSSTDDSSSTDAAASSSSDSTPAASATTAAAAPAAADDTASSADDTAEAGDSGDGSDPLAGTATGDTLARVALVVVRGDAPIRWATAPAGSAARKRAATGTTFTGLATLPSAPLATGLGYIAGQPSNPATRAGCTAPSPVAPGIVDSAGIAAGAGCDYPAETPSLAGSVAREGLAWKAFAPGASPQEAAARLCHPTDGNGSDALKAFAQRGPLGHLGDLTTSGACDTAAGPLSSLKADLTADTAPSWVYIEVGDCGTDGCDATESAARDADLDTALATLAATAPPEDGKSATLVVGDGDVQGLAPADAGSYPAAPGDPEAPAAVVSGALLIGDNVTAGSTDPIALSPFSIARTQATWLGLTAPGLGAADGETALATPGS